MEDYNEMDFRQVVKFGENTTWGWVMGAEIIFGGAVGGVGGLAAGPAGGLFSAVVTAAALVGASAGAKSLLTSDEPASPPEMPARPTRPIEGDQIDPNEDGLILTVILPDGEISGSGLDPRFRVRGAHEDGYVEIMSNINEK